MSRFLTLAAAAVLMAAALASLLALAGPSGAPAAQASCAAALCGFVIF